MCTKRKLRSAWTSAQSGQSSLGAQWVAKDPRFLHEDSEDSDQTGRMPRLIWVFVGRTCHLLVLSCGNSYKWRYPEKNPQSQSRSTAFRGTIKWNAEEHIMTKKKKKKRKNATYETTDKQAKVNCYWRTALQRSMEKLLKVLIQFCLQ